MSKNHHLDCLVIGAGPAGLTAALYLRRFCHEIVVIDNGHSRALSIESAKNFPGAPHGISGRDLLNLLRNQVADVQASVVNAEVASLTSCYEGFNAVWNSSTFRFRTVLLATGVIDVIPELEGIEAVARQGLLRYCPICDGYEHRKQRILVIGDGVHAAREAAFLAHYGAYVSHAKLTDTPTVSVPGVTLLPAPAKKIAVAPHGEVSLLLSNNQSYSFDVVYVANKVRPRSELGTMLGAQVDSLGSLKTDEHGATCVAGLYAAGDVACGLDQLVVAAARGAIAATAIHNLLRP